MPTYFNRYDLADEKRTSIVNKFLAKNGTHSAQLIFLNHLTGAAPKTVLAVLCFGSIWTQNLSGDYGNKRRHTLNCVHWLRMLQYYAEI